MSSSRKLRIQIERGPGTQECMSQRRYAISRSGDPRIHSPEASKRLISLSGHAPSGRELAISQSRNPYVSLREMTKGTSSHLAVIAHGAAW